MNNANAAAKMIETAKKYEAQATMRDSAELCRAEAEAALAAGNPALALAKAVWSLRYSVGIAAPAYAGAVAAHDAAVAELEAVVAGIIDLCPSKDDVAAHARWRALLDGANSNLWAARHAAPSKPKPVTPQIAAFKF